MRKNKFHYFWPPLEKFWNNCQVAPLEKILPTPMTLGRSYHHAVHEMFSVPGLPVAPDRVFTYGYRKSKFAWKCSIGKAMPSTRIPSGFTLVFYHRVFFLTQNNFKVFFNINRRHVAPR